MNINRSYILISRQFKNISRYKSTQTSAEYCLDQIKKYDYENFICTLLLKNPARSVALAVRGFNVEVSRVTEQVTQETTGLMRLKFWEDAIDKCYSKDFKDVPKHPVAVELFKALSKASLSKRYLKNLISARMQYINMHGFKNLAEMEKYAELTVSNSYYLILEGSGVKNMEADHAASHLGKAQGITQQLRSVPHAKKLNFLPVPEDILIKHQLSQEEVIRGKETKKLTDCIYETASRAHQHLVKSRSLLDKIPAEARSVLLPAVSVSIYLDRLQKVDYNVMDPRLQQRSWKMLPYLYLSNLRNIY